MKFRLLVLNGQRIVQTEQGGTWKNQEVGKAGALKPGIYNLYLAQKADKSQHHNSIIVYADNNNVYQQIGKHLVMHARSDFDRVPGVGSRKSITYDAQGKAVVSAAAIKSNHGRSR